MSDYITRTAAVNVLHYNCDEKCSAVVLDMENIPSEDVAPVVHGKWIKDHEYNITCVQSTNYHCSNCGRKSGYKQVKLYKYCPKCGAKMELQKGV